MKHIDQDASFSWLRLEDRYEQADRMTGGWVASSVCMLVRQRSLIRLLLVWLKPSKASMVLLTVRKAALSVRARQTTCNYG